MQASAGGDDSAEHRALPCSGEREAPRVAKRPADEPGSPKKRSRGGPAARRALAGVLGGSGRQKLSGNFSAAKTKAAFYAEQGKHDEAEQVLGEFKLKQCAAQHCSMDIVKELQSKSKTDFFDYAVDASMAAGYYQEGSSEFTAWGTEVMHFEKMLQRAAKKIYDRDPRIRLAQVEKDFNTMIYNAVIYNCHTHVVNTEALKLRKAAESVFRKWQNKGESP